MPRLVEFDLAEALAPRVPIWVTQVGIGLLSVSGTVVVRGLIDFVSPGIGPFALVYPGIMIATLAGRWLAGLVSGVILIIGAWYYLLPPKNSFDFGIPNGPATMFVISFAALLTIAIAEIFRRAVRNAADERDQQIADRDLFLEEFDHRVKNNFAIVVSLLELQRRRADPATAQALEATLMRVESIARAHRHLYRGSDRPGMVQIADYLGELCTALADVLTMRGAITLTCASDSALLPRDRAVSIGLVVNELVTNAAKHAFVDRERGSIDVSFKTLAGGWRLVVSDDGSGIAKARRDSTGGLGSKLIDGFARQAGGTIDTDSDATGTRVTLNLAA